MTSRAFAVYSYPNNGRKTDKAKTKHFKLNGKPIEVADIKIEKSTTYVLLNGCWYNSVQFEFYDENKLPIDLYGDAQYNPYLQYKLSV